MDNRALARSRRLTTNYAQTETRTFLHAIALRRDEQPSKTLLIPLDERMGTRARRIEHLPDNLFDYAQAPERRLGRPVKHHLAGWRVIDDWPERVPVTEREVDVFESWFGDILDAMFGLV